MSDYFNRDKARESYSETARRMGSGMKTTLLCWLVILVCEQDLLHTMKLTSCLAQVLAARVSALKLDSFMSQDVVNSAL